MNSHLVAVEVGVKSGAGEGMQLNGLALDQNRLKRLNTQAVQGRRTVQKDRMLFDNILQNVPYLGASLFHHALGGLHIVCQLAGNELLHDERLEQLQRHFLGQTALIELKLRTDNNNGTAGIVHALAQQVLTETSLLAAQQVRQTL